MAVLEAAQSRYFTSNPIKEVHKDFIKASHLNRRRVRLAKDYTLIIRTIFTKIFKEIVTNGYEFKYKNLGVFSCIKYLPSSIITKKGTVFTNKPVNFPATFKIRKETGNNKLFVYYDNYETGGYTFKVIWDKGINRFTNQSYYVLKLHKTLKKWLYERIVDGTITARVIDIKI